VFAVWSARRSLTRRTRSRLAALLADSLALGLESIPQIAASAAGKLGDREAIAAYLSDFTYRFESSERKAFRTFHRMVRETELVPEAPHPAAFAMS